MRFNVWQIETFSMNTLLLPLGGSTLGSRIIETAKKQERVFERTTGRI